MPGSGDIPRRSFLRWREIPGGVWALGIVSLLMDLSSEMIHALLPLYLVAAFGASMLTVGIIEGVAEATAAIVKVFSGALSDRLGRRKLLAALGYGLAALTKPVFPLAPTIGWLAAARFADRLGKGIRGAPRDALIADLSPAAVRGASFGLRQSLDTVGAFLGPLLAAALMLAFANDFTTVFWFAVAPAVLAVAVIVLGVREPSRQAGREPAPMPLRRAALARLGRAYWLVVAISTVFTLARFGEAFLLLRAQSVGVALAFAPLVLVAMNAVYALSAWPAGVLSDRIGRRGVLAAGIAMLSLADLVLAFAAGPTMLAAGVAVWGLHMGLTQGLFATLVADAAPAGHRGMAFGLFNFATGVSLLTAGALAGFLWDGVGPRQTYLAGALLAAVALATLALAGRTLPDRGPGPGEQG